MSALPQIFSPQAPSRSQPPSQSLGAPASGTQAKPNGGTAPHGGSGAATDEGAPSFGDALSRHHTKDNDAGSARAALDAADQHIPSGKAELLTGTSALVSVLDDPSGDDPSLTVSTEEESALTPTVGFADAEIEPESVEDLADPVTEPEAVAGQADIPVEPVPDTARTVEAPAALASALPAPGRSSDPETQAQNGAAPKSGTATSATPAIPVQPTSANGNARPDPAAQSETEGPSKINPQATARAASDPAADTGPIPEKTATELKSAAPDDTSSQRTDTRRGASDPASREADVRGGGLPEPTHIRHAADGPPMGPKTAAMPVSADTPIDAAKAATALSRSSAEASVLASAAPTPASTPISGMSERLAASILQTVPGQGAVTLDKLPQAVVAVALTSRSATLQIDPPELGRIRLDYQFDSSGRTVVTLTPESDAARTALSERMPTITAALEQGSGSSVDVRLGSASDFGAAFGQASGEDGEGAGTDGGEGDAGQPDAAGAVATAPQTLFTADDGTTRLHMLI
ncbi:MAG: hypothetical protein AAF311_02770 [Pseudomonadota bacterium]